MIRCIKLTQQPISGAYVKVLYEFEDVFGFPPGNVISEDAAKGVTRILGHGIKVDSWSRDNGLNPVIGLNNVEPSDIVDGPFNGTFSLSFAMIGDIAWMKAIMGQEVVVSTSPSLKRYTKNIAPPSMTFVIYMNNDNENPTKGDMFLVTGVVVSGVQISTSEDSAVQVQMDCMYKTERKFDDITDIPIINSPSDNVFNNSMVNAYFWNPNTDINGPSSFDSIECTIDKVNFSIRHTANLIRGIGTRLAKNKVHANIMYDMSMSAIFKDPKKFLERFYGCPTGPAKYIAPYSQIKIIVENFARDSKHAKIEFAFRNAKIKTSGMPLAIENVIMEELSILPTSCNIEITRGCPAEASVYLSPLTVVQGGELHLSGANFIPGEVITLKSGTLNIYDGSSGVTTTANCLGELEYPIILGTEHTSAVLPGHYDIEVSSPISMNPKKTFELTVIGASGTTSNVPQFSICKNTLKDNAETVSMNGYNFGVQADGVITISLEQYYPGSGEWVSASGRWSNETILAADAPVGMFTYSNDATIDTGSEGKYRLVASRGTVAGGDAKYEASAIFYVPSINVAQLNSGKTTVIFSGSQFVPNSNVSVSYVDGTTVVPLGIYATNTEGVLEQITYVRSVAFTHTDPKLDMTVIGANGGGTAFTIEKDITEL